MRALILAYYFVFFQIEEVAPFLVTSYPSHLLVYILWFAVNYRNLILKNTPVLPKIATQSQGRHNTHQPLLIFERLPKSHSISSYPFACTTETYHYC